MDHPPSAASPALVGPELNRGSSRSGSMTGPAIDFEQRCGTILLMNEVEVVLANNDRVTVRVGDAFYKVDSDRDRSDREVEAIRRAPVPTPKILWYEPPVLALAAVPGRPLGELEDASMVTAAAWAAVGAVVRRLHESPLPDRTGPTPDDLERRLRDGCDWLVTNDVLPSSIVERNQRLAEGVLGPFTPTLIHGDLHLKHVFVQGDEVSGIIDWSEMRQGDPLFDVASLTLGNQDRLDEFLVGYGHPVDHDRVRAWWAWRCLVVVRWLVENGYGPPDSYPEVAVLRTLI